MNDYKWEDLSLGMKHTFEASFTEDMIRDFALLSGDGNPLHVDAEYARSCGYKDAVIFGLMTSSLYSRLVGMYIPGKYALLQGIDIDFNAPCHAGERLSVEGEISHMNEACRQIEIRARIRKIDRTLVSKSTIRVGLHG